MKDKLKLAADIAYDLASDLVAPLAAVHLAYKGSPYLAIGLVVTISVVNVASAYLDSPADWTE